MNLDNNDSANQTSPPVELKQDQLLGLYANVSEAEAEGLRDWLVESEVLFEMDPERGTRLACLGHRLFLFGNEHPATIRKQILDYGLPVQIEPTLVLVEDTFRPPLNKLLTLGETRRHGTGIDYAALGITREHVLELIRMVLDEQLHTGPTESKIVYAPVHAWWALAQLRADEAIVPLLGLLQRIDTDHDDWVGEDLPLVFAEFGAAAILPLADYLSNVAHGEWARVAAAHSFSEIGKRHPTARDECVARLSRQLEHFATQSDTLNAFLISYLLDLRAVEAAPLMEQVHASGYVDESVHGDWEDAQIELGLKAQREHSRKPNKLSEIGDQLRAMAQANDELDALLGEDDFSPPPRPYIAAPKTGRNDPCPCGSGKKYKKCCGK